MVVETLGLQEYLMPVAVPEPVDLVLDGGAIARTLCINRAAEQGRAIEPSPNDLMRPRIGAGDRAEHLG